MIEDYLKKQQEVRAVDLFSEQYETIKSGDSKKYFKHLIPQDKPAKDEQLAFEVNLDQCTGCKCCVTSCHSENGLNENETWRSVGLLIGDEAGDSVVQHVTTSCHQCLEPACSYGCPVKAYEKDEVTGIVIHLDDQCIGCQYCIFKCPYGAPQYDRDMGIVRKCDMCISRLNVGEAPACVRGCPNEAISIVKVKKEAVRETAVEFVDIPGAPSPNITFPSTSYRSKKRLGSKMNSADAHTIRPQECHFPLVLFLVFTQLSTGAYGADFLFKQFIATNIVKLFSPFSALIALGGGILAMVTSVLHLGRPKYAFRAFLGLRTSWLSREIVSVGIFSVFAGFYSLTFFISSFWPGKLPYYLTMDKILSLGVLFFGFLAIVSSIMVYVDTKRPFWASYVTTVKFFLTPGILGITTVFPTSVYYIAHSAGGQYSDIISNMTFIFPALLITFTIAKILSELVIFSNLRDKKMTYFKKTALLMLGELKNFTMWRFIFALLGGIFIPLFVIFFGASLSVSGILAMATLMFIFSLAGEMLERFLFFKAVIPLKMPGGLIT